MADVIKNIYDAMSQHYDMTDDYDTFARSMSGPDVRKRVYAAMSEHYTMDDWQIFDSTLTGVAGPRNGNGGQVAAVRPQSQSSVLMQNADILDEEIERRLQGRLQIQRTEAPVEEQAPAPAIRPSGAGIFAFDLPGNRERQLERYKQEAASGKFTKPRGFFDTLKDTSPTELMPFISGAIQTGELKGIYDATKRLEADKATEADLIILQHFQDQSAQKTTWGGQVADIIKMMPAFALEIGATAGVYGVGQRLAAKGIGETLKWLVEKEGVNALKGQLEKFAQKKGLSYGAARIAGGLVGGTLQTIPASITRIPAGAIQRMMPEYQIDKTDAGELAGVINKEGDDFWPALRKAAGDQWVEVTSEHTGGLLPLLGGPLAEKAAKLALVRTIKRLNPLKTGKEIKGFIESVGYHGIIGEMFEERAGEAMRAAIGLEDYKLPNLQQLSVEFVGFAVPGVAYKATDLVVGSSEEKKAKKAYDDYVTRLGRKAVVDYSMEQKAKPFMEDIEAERNAWLAQNAEAQKQNEAYQRMTGGAITVQPSAKDLTPEVEADLAARERGVEGEVTEEDLIKQAGEVAPVSPAKTIYPLIAPDGTVTQVPFDQLPQIQQEIIERYSGSREATFPLIDENGKVSYARFDQLPSAQQVILAMYAGGASQERQLALPPGRGTDFIGTETGIVMTPEQQADYVEFAKNVLPGNMPVNLAFGRPAIEETKVPEVVSEVPQNIGNLATDASTQAPKTPIVPTEGKGEAEQPVVEPASAGEAERPLFVIDDEGKLAKVVKWDGDKPVIVYPGNEGGKIPGTGGRVYEYTLDNFTPVTISDFNKAIRPGGSQKQIDLRMWRDQHLVSGIKKGLPEQKRVEDEQAKDNRRSVLQNRARLGKDVPAKLLQEFKGEEWADKILTPAPVPATEPVEAKPAAEGEAGKIVPELGTIEPKLGTEAPVVSTYPSDFFSGISEERAKGLSGSDVAPRDAGFKYFDKLNPDEQKGVLDYAEKRVEEQYNRFHESKEQSDFALLGDYNSELQALKNKMPPSAEPDIHVEKRPVELILPKSGVPYKTQQAAQRKANELGNNDYEVVSHKGGYAVRPRGIPMKAKAIRPATEIPKTRQEVDLEKGLAEFAKGFPHISFEINESPYDLPREDLTQAVLNEGARGQRVLALYDPKTGKVHMLLSGIVDLREGIVAATHDIVGHAGVQQMLGPVEFNRFIGDLLKDKRLSPEIQKLAKEYNWSSEYAAGEWFAQKAERENWDSLPHSLKDRVIFWLKQALRRLLGANRISFSDKEIEQLIRDSYKYAKSDAKNEAIAGRKGGEAPPFRTQNIRVLKDQLGEVYKALRELPEVRYGQPTEIIQKRLVEKAEEIEQNILHIQTNVPFSSKPSADMRLQKKIEALEKGIPEKDKDAFVRKRMSTLIKNEIGALKKGHRLGQLDLRQALLEPKQLILEYVRKYLPQDDLTKGMVSPLLTQAMRATTPDDVAATFDRIDNIMRRVSIKQMREKFDDLLTKYKPKKKEGKITGPSLMPDEYKALDNIRDVVDLSEEVVEIQVNRLYDKIDTQNDDAVAQKEKVDEIDPKDQEALYLLQTFGNIKGKDQKDMQHALEVLGEIIKDGRAKRVAENEARQEEVQAWNKGSVEIVSKGKGVLTQAEIAEAGGLKEPGFFTNTIYENLRFENVLDELDGGEKGSTVFRGRFNRRFASMINNSINAETRGVRENFAIISGKAQEIFGTTDAKEMVKMAEKMNLPEDTGITIIQKGKPVRLVLSQDQAAKKWAEWQDFTLRDKFAGMGWTQDTIDKLETWLTPQMKKWAEWQLHEWYPTYYHGVNEAFRKMFYVDLPYNPMYTPLSVVYEKAGDDANDQMLRSNQRFFARVIGKHLLSRTKNTREIKNSGLNSMLIAHMVEMEHFKAWAETIRDLRATFNNEEMRAAIKQNYGKSMMARIDDTINTMARGGLKSEQVGEWLTTLRHNFSIAALGFNLTMIPKQLASFPAYAADIPVMEWFNGLGTTITHFPTAIEVLKNSELMKARYGIGWDRDVMLNFQRAEAQMIGGVKNWKQKAMFATKIGDAGAIVFGGYPVYLHHLNKALKEGKTQTEAEKIAMYEFETSTRRSQQSGSIPDMPALMRDSALWRLFTMFQSAPSSYFNMTYSALANLKRGRGSKAENLKRFAIANSILPVLFALVDKAFTWDDESIISAAITGSLNGLLFWGNIIEPTVKGAVTAYRGGRAFAFGGIGGNPVFENLDYTKTVIERVMRQAGKGDISEDDILKTIDMMVDAVGKVAGIPYAGPSRYAKNIYQITESGDIDPRRLMGYSEYALKPTIAEKKSKPPSERLRPERTIERKERIGR